MGSHEVGGAWSENCGEYMGIDGLTLHRGAASGAVSIKGALCIRTWCIY